MDRLKFEIERLTDRINAALYLRAVSRRRKTMTPKFRGISERLKKLQHNLDADAEKLDARIAETEDRSKHVFAKTHKSLDDAHQNLDGINDFLTEIEGTNSGERPTSRDSSNGSDQPRSTEIATKR